MSTNNNNICPREPDMDDCKTKKKRCLTGPCNGGAYTDGEECPTGYDFNPETCECEPRGLFDVYGWAYFCPAYSDGRFGFGGPGYCPGACSAAPADGPDLRGGPVYGCDSPRVVNSYGDQPGGFPSCGFASFNARSEIFCETLSGTLARFTLGGGCGSCTPYEMVSAAWYLIPEDTTIDENTEPTYTAGQPDLGQPPRGDDIDPGAPWE